MQYLNNDLVVETFDSTFEFVKAIESRPNSKAMEGQIYSSKEGASWYGTKNMDEANLLLKRGWDKGCDDLTVALNNLLKAPKRTNTMDVVGFAPCVPAYLQGVPLNMYNSKMEKRETRVVTINYDRGQSCGVSDAAIQDASVKLLAVVKAIEKSNCKVNLNIIWGVREQEQTAILKMKLKDCAESLNLLTVAYPLVNTSFMRRHCFKWLETAPFITDRHFREGYGYPLHIKYKVAADYKKYLVENDVIKKDEFLITTDTLKHISADELAEHIVKNDGWV